MTGIGLMLQIYIMKGFSIYFKLKHIFLTLIKYSKISLNFNKEGQNSV